VSDHASAPSSQSNVFDGSPRELKRAPLAAPNDIPPGLQSPGIRAHFEKPEMAAPRKPMAGRLLDKVLERPEAPAGIDIPGGYSPPDVDSDMEGTYKGSTPDIPFDFQLPKLGLDSLFGGLF
jgi:hypothetical protein